MGTFLVLASVSFSIGLGFVLTKFLLGLMLAVMPSLDGVRAPKGD